MSALRLARAFTERTKIVKFVGCYHGHADLLLVQAGSGVATLGLPDSPGVTPGAVEDTLTAPFNDLDAVERLFDAHDDIAAVIVEPVAGNMGLVLPQPGFLEGLRELTADRGALLVFDEVMTGFRVHPGGAQALYGVTPDLTTLGKVIGGGLPVGAYGGRREIMELVAPAGPVYQAGTLSGNPLAMTARNRDAACDRRARRVGRARPRRRAARGGTRLARLRRAGRTRRDDVRHVLLGRARHELGRSRSSRYRALRRVPPGDARARRLPRAVAVRGRLPLHGSRRLRDRRDDRGRWRTRSPVSDLGSTLRGREGPARDDVLPARRWGRRAALAQARAVPAGARHRDPRARAGRSEVGAPRPRAARTHAGLDPSRSLRRPTREEARRGAPRGGRGSTARSSRHRSPPGACSSPTRA